MAKTGDQPPEPSDDGIAAWRALLRAHSAALRAIEADMVAAGTMSLGWYDVLLELWAAPDQRLRMQELGHRVVLSRTRVSRLVDELEAAGYVRREPCPDDRRSAFAVLTPDGRNARRKAARVYLASIERNFSRHLTGTQRRAIELGLTKVATAALGQV